MASSACKHCSLQMRALPRRRRAPAHRSLTTSTAKCPARAELGRSKVKLLPGLDPVEPRRCDHVMPTRTQHPVIGHRWAWRPLHWGTASRSKAVQRRQQAPTLLRRSAWPVTTSPVLPAGRRRHAAASTRAPFCRPIGHGLEPGDDRNGRHSDPIPRRRVDDTAQIQAAINRLPDGQVVHLEAGTLIINSDNFPAINNGITSHGAGPGRTTSAKINGAKPFHKAVSPNPSPPIIVGPSRYSTTSDTGGVVGWRWLAERPTRSRTKRIPDDARRLDGPTAEPSKLRPSLHPPCQEYQRPLNSDLVMTVETVVSIPLSRGT